MPKLHQKQREDLTHHFISRALTDSKTNVSIYGDRKFNVELRLVAINAILVILQKINSKMHHAYDQKHHLTIADLINTQHSVTGLTMLDYCMAAGFNDLALELMHNGATSKNVAAFQTNIRRHFATKAQPDILQDIQTIVEGYQQIERQCEQLATTTERVMPGIMGAVNDLWQRSSPVTLVLLGVGCAALAPILHPLIHVHGIGSAALVSAGFMPAALLGLGRTPPKKIDTHDFVLRLTDMAQKISSDLTAQKKGMQSCRRASELVPEPEPELNTSLLHLFANSERQRSRQRGAQEAPALRKMRLRAMPLPFE